MPTLKFVMVVDGRIEPGEAPGTSPGFEEAMGALYSAAYTLRFMSKLRKEDPIDYPVMALEGLWWVEDGEFNITIKDNWVYTLMIMQPDHITPEVFGEALAQVARKRPIPALARLRLETFREGLCVQIMNISPYATESATIAKMERWAAALRVAIEWPASITISTWATRAAPTRRS